MQRHGRRKVEREQDFWGTGLSTPQEAEEGRWMVAMEWAQERAGQSSADSKHSSHLKESKNTFILSQIPWPRNMDLGCPERQVLTWQQLPGVL